MLDLTYIKSYQYLNTPLTMGAEELWLSAGDNLQLHSMQPTVCVMKA